jgi:hypothetical protein
MKKIIIFLLLGFTGLISTNLALRAQEFPIAVGVDTTFSGGAVYGGLNGLVAVQGNIGNQYSINAQLIGSGGTLIGSRIPLSTNGVMPGAIPVFDGTNYFLVWCEYSGTLKGQLINTSGTLVGNSFTISTNVSVERPGLYGVVFGETMSLVAFVKTDGFLYGQRIDTNGNLMGGQVKISSNLARDISIAYDGTNFLTAWVEVIPDTDKDIFGQFVSKTSTLVGANFLIDGGPNYSDNPTSLAFDGIRYLLAYHESTGKGANWSLLGRFISKTGEIQETITICDTPQAPMNPSVAFDNFNYLITWTQFSNGSLMGRFFNKSGIPIDTTFEIFGSLDNKIPLGGVGFGGGLYLAIATRINSNFSNGDVYGRFIPSSVVGIKENKISNRFFDLFPNPAIDVVTLNIDNTYNSNLILNIYNVNGALVRSEMLKQHNQKINIRNLNNGIYVVEIKSQEWTKKQKLIIKK